MGSTDNTVVGDVQKTKRKVEIILDLKVSKTVEIDEALFDPKTPEAEELLLEALMEATPLISDTWDRFTVYGELYVDPTSRIDVFTNQKAQQGDSVGETHARDFHPDYVSESAQRDS